MVPYKAADPEPEDCEVVAENTHLSPTKARPSLHHRRHSSLVYKKSTADISPSKAFPRSPSDTTDELSGDPEAFLDASLDVDESGSLHERRHNSIVSGNLERRESILRSIVRVENRERELLEHKERRGSPAEPAPIDSTGLRKLSLQGRPARRRASTPCVSTPSPIMDSPVAQLPSPPSVETEGALALQALDPATTESPPRDAAALLSNLEPQVTRETDISSAPTSLGLAGGSRNSLLRASVSTSVATDEEPRVRFATPDEMRATFRRQIHRESTLATLTGPQRSRPEVDILDHDHLASILSKQEYAATITPATSTTNSVASASSVPRYRQRREQEAPAPDYVASAYTGDATAGITESSGFGLGEGEGPGAAATAPGPTRRCTLLCVDAAATAAAPSAVRAVPSCPSSSTTTTTTVTAHRHSPLPGTAMSTRSTTSCLILRRERRAQVSSRRWAAGSALLMGPRVSLRQNVVGGASSSHRRRACRRVIGHLGCERKSAQVCERTAEGCGDRAEMNEGIPSGHDIRIIIGYRARGYPPPQRRMWASSF